MLNILYLARLREDLGVSSETLVLPETVGTVGDLRAHLAARGGAWAAFLAANKSVRIAVNQDMAVASTPLGSEDEVAFFPPVTGG